MLWGSCSGAKKYFEPGPFNYFHIDLRAPQRVDLPHNLLVDGAASDQASPSDALIANAQAWLDQVKTDLNLTQGEVTMLIPDMPNVPPQELPVMIAQANQAQAGDTTKIRVLGVCSPVPNNNYSAENGLVPIESAKAYLEVFEKNQTVTGPATTTILKQPGHGVLRLITEADGNRFGEGKFVAADQLYVYFPSQDFVGDDTATILVDFGGGLKVQVKYFFQAMSHGLSDDWVNDYCSEKGPYWKISSTIDPNGNSTINTFEYRSPTISSAGRFVTTAKLDLLGTAKNSFFGMKRKEPRSE